MAEQTETLTGTIASLEAHPPAERFATITIEELENRKAELADFLGIKDKIEETSPNVNSMLRHAAQRAYEDIAVEQIIRTKKPEKQQAYRQAYYEGDILRKRAQVYEQWSEEMQAKYGDKWEEKVPEDEWYKIAEITTDEQRAYQQHLAIRVEAKAISQTTYEALKKCQTTEDVIAVEADRATSNQHVYGEIKKAFPHLTDEAIRVIQSDAEYILFDIGETFRLLGKMIAYRVKEVKDHVYVSDDTLVVQFADGYTERAINLIKRLLTRKRIQEQLALLQNPQQAMELTMEGQAGEQGGSNEPSILSNTKSTARNRAQPPAKVAT